VSLLHFQDHLCTVVPTPSLPKGATQRTIRYNATPQQPHDTGGPATYARRHTRTHGERQSDHRSYSRSGWNRSTRSLHVADPALGCVQLALLPPLSPTRPVQTGARKSFASYAGNGLNGHVKSSRDPPLVRSADLLEQTSGWYSRGPKLTCYQAHEQPAR
jgi:hypothetical protein